MKPFIIVILCLTAVRPVGAQEDFRQLVESAIERGEKIISIPKGNYTLMEKDYKSVTLKDLKDITIDANGSTIICKKPSRAFDLINCENVRLANFTVDYDPLPYTQGRIVEMGENKEWWILQIPEGYPVREIDLTRNRANIYDPGTNLIKRNTGTFGAWGFEPDIEYLGDRKIKLTRVVRGGSDSSEEVGDFFVALLKNEGCRRDAFFLEKTRRCTLENVTIYTANMFAIRENECEANHYLRCVITKNLNDPKVVYPRLRSAGGDAFHSKCASQGPVIEECTFEHQGDDCVNIGTRYHIVLKSEGFSVYILSTTNSTYIEPGNRLQVVSAEGKLKGNALVGSVQPVDDIPAVEIKEATDMYRMRTIPEFVFRFELEESFPFSVGDLVCSLDKAGDGYVLKNNKFGYTRARGALLKGTGGTVTGNIFEGSMLAAIIVAPEFYWMEGTYATDLNITGNTFRNCYYGRSKPHSSQCGIITVICLDRENRIIDSEGGFRNIHITDNRIEECPFPAVVLTGINGGEFRRNTILKSSDIIRNHGADYGFSNQEAICTRFLEDFVIGNNCVVTD